MADEIREHLKVYLADHLAGARGALDLIAHLRDHAADGAVRTLMAGLHRDVEFDRMALEQMALGVGASAHPVKEISAWLAERMSRVKLGAGAVADGLAQFEAVEAITLGIMGKVKLWNALIASGAPGMDQAGLTRLREQALEQHQRVERERGRLATAVFGAPG